jgi:ATP-dependent RNA helicase DDX56/DBP9
LKSLLLSKPAEVDCDDVEEMEQKEREEREMRKELKKKKKPLITHFGLEIKKGKNDKLLYLMALLRLGLCKKKILIFVKDADEAVRARLFLHKFGVLCVALHSELPANSRAHRLEEFNRGVHDVLVAAAEDDSSSNSSNDGSNANEKENAKEEEEEEEEQPTRKSKKERKKEKEKRNQAAKKDSEFGVSRGVDFKKVHTVINFEVPKTFEAYQHRVGRTGRAGATGVAITFFGPSDEEAYHVLLKGYADAAAVAKAAEAKEEDDDEEEDEREEEDVDDFLKPFERLPKEATEALRYRAEDTLRSISKSAVKDARLRELRVELLNSERLASHFEENPDDLNLLRHDSSISKRDDANKHLSHLPAYLRNASKKKRKKNAINAVETEDGDEAKWAAMRLDVDVAEFGQKKKRRRKDKREGGKQKKTREEVGAKVKRKAGRKRSR